MGMSAKRILALMCLAVILLTGCSGENQNIAFPGYEKIGADEAKDMMEGKDVIILDVRSREDYQREHIPGAVSLPNDEVEEGAENVLPDKDAIILIYCKSGKNSAAAAEKLVKMGYKKVYDFGGIIDWPYETVK
jgi:phage shock protein E